MTDLEKQIIQLITQCRHLSEELKKQYILAMFLMETDKQEEYLRLLQAFMSRCQQMDRGIFVVRPNEMKRVMKTYEQVKEDLIRKLSYSNKTLIEHLKELTRLGILIEDMEKVKKSGRILWLKNYVLSDLGRWFALLIQKEEKISLTEKKEIICNTFRQYIRT